MAVFIHWQHLPVYRVYVLFTSATCSLLILITSTLLKSVTSKLYESVWSASINPFSLMLRFMLISHCWKVLLTNINIPVHVQNKDLPQDCLSTFLVVVPQDRAYEIVEDMEANKIRKMKKRICLVLDCLCAHDFSDKTADLINLQHYVIKEKRLSEREAIVIFYDVVRVVEALHKVSHIWYHCTPKSFCPINCACGFLFCCTALSCPAGGCNLFVAHCFWILVSPAHVPLPETNLIVW